jgi:hypothetical protein
VHLVENRVLYTDPDPRALCGNKAVLRTRTPFSLNGWKRCCKAAMKAGLTTVVDVDGDLVDVQAVLDAA